MFRQRVLPDETDAKSLCTAVPFGLPELGARHQVWAQSRGITCYSRWLSKTMLLPLATSRTVWHRLTGGFRKDQRPWTKGLSGGVRTSQQTVIM